jgi:hypothetical protein
LRAQKDDKFGKAEVTDVKESVSIKLQSAVRTQQGMPGIPLDKAGAHIGETAKICGNVAKGTYALKDKGSPTFLNLDKAYPNEIFTVVIWGEDREKFGTPENDYLYKDICLNGAVEQGPRVPQIVARDRKQIEP